jgi:gluconolactonase
MNIRSYSFLTILCLLPSFFTKAQSTGALFVQDELKLIAADFSFTEGCSVDKNGDVFFTDQPNDKIWKYSQNGKLSVFLSPSGRANGTYFDKKGNLITCADEHGELRAVSPSGKEKIILKSPAGEQFNGPNDVWIHPNGGMYFTDPYYQRDYWTRKVSDRKTDDVYYLPKGKKQVKVAASDMLKPNGIVGTPDGKHLYVADIKAGKTYKFNIEKDGTLSQKQLLISKGSDGMTLDQQGNIYLTSGGGVFIYNAEGKFLQQIKMAENPSNVCFFGKDRDMLFITSRKAVYMLPMTVKGVE